MARDQKFTKTFKQFLARVNKGEEAKVCEALRKNSELAIAVDEHGETALHKAARTGNVKIGETLIKERPECLNMASNLRFNALHLASEYNNPEFAEMLLKLGAERELTLRDGALTALHLAAKNRSQPCLAVLLQANCRTDIRSKTGKVPLHYAAASCDVEMMKALIERERNHDLQDKDNNTALHIAVQHGVENPARCLEAVKYLTGHEVTVNPLIQNKSKETAEDIAVKSGNKTVAAHIKEYSKKYTKWAKMLEKSVPQDKIKLFFCGERNAGKTTLLNSLDATWFQRTFGRKDGGGGGGEKDDGDALSLGIQIRDLHLPSCGTFSAWDLGGDMRNNVTIEYLLGGVDSIFLLLVDVTASDDERAKQIGYWLSVIRTCSFADTCVVEENAEDVRRPRVIIALTHVDMGDGMARYRGIEKAREVASQFRAYLDVDDGDVVCVNCTDPSGREIAELKQLIGRHYKEIIKRLPKIDDVCRQTSDEIEKNLRDGKIQPIIRFNDFWTMVRRDVNPIISADNSSSIKTILNCLARSGRVIYVRWSDSTTSWVALDPNWLCNDLFKPLFLTEKNQRSTWSSEDGLISRDDLKNRFPRFHQDILIEILKAYRLCTHELRFPSLIARTYTMTEATWQPSDDLQLYTGRRFCCKTTCDEDVLLPGFFPKLQVKALAEQAQRVWHGGFVVAMRTDRTIQALVELDPHRRAYVDVVVRGRDGDADRCLLHLERIQRWINDVAFQSSPVTALEIGVLSVASLKGHLPPDQRFAYPLETVIEAEALNRTVDHEFGDEKFFEKPIELLYCGVAEESQRRKGVQMQCAFLGRGVLNEVEHLLDERNGALNDLPWVKLAREFGIQRMIAFYNVNPRTALGNVIRSFVLQPQCRVKAFTKILMAIDRGDALRVVNRANVEHN